MTHRDHGVGAVRLDITSRRAVKWYLGVLLALTACGGILHWLVAPPTGLVRTFYSDGGFVGEPLFPDRTTEVSLAFLDEDSTLPRRFFSVQWCGFWFLSRAQTVDLYAGADDRVDVRVDGQLVLRRNFSVGTHTIGETLTLGAGPHEISVRYEQEGGGASLNVQRAFEGERLGAFVPTRLFPERPDIQDFWLVTGTSWLIRLVAVLWLAPTAGLFLVIAGWARRRPVHYWRTVGAPRTVGDFGRRLHLVAFPALLGPFVLFLLGPHTIYLKKSKSPNSDTSGASAITWTYSWRLRKPAGGVTASERRMRWSDVVDPAPASPGAEVGDCGTTWAAVGEARRARTNRHDATKVERTSPMPPFYA